VAEKPPGKTTTLKLSGRPRYIDRGFSALNPQNGKENAIIKKNTNSFLTLTSVNENDVYY